MGTAQTGERATAPAQAAVIEFLASPATHGGSVVERIDTHSAVVFLAGSRALKLKRAVAFDYLDFSTPERRHAACEAEVRINRRTAAAIYRGVVAITREPDGRLALGGTGEPVDWCVDMERFDQEQLLDRLAGRNGVTLDIAERLADAVARFHLTAEPRHDQGGVEGMRWVITGNARGFAEQGEGILAPAACAALTAAALAELERRAALIDRRRATGCVRQCHGDLHLRNIVLIDGAPTPFDAIEFNDAIACGDVFYDLAFLLMDVWRRDLRGAANALLGGYLARTLDFEGLALLPLFLSCRAAVRAKTSATTARLQSDPVRRQESEALARDYVTMAAGFLRPATPTLVAIGGLSGSGKSTLARGLASDVGPVPGAVVLRSDALRKSLCGVQPFERLGPDGYTADVSARVYEVMVDRARAALGAGHAVIADAAFLQPDERAAIEAAATEASVPFVGLWLEAPSGVLTARVEGRSGDASDADATVLGQQLRRDLGPITWQRLDASGSAPILLADVRRQIS